MAFSDIISLEDRVMVAEAEYELVHKLMIGSLVALMLKDILSERMTPWERS